MTTKNKTYSPEFKAKVVIDRIKGKPTSEICNEYSISKSTLYDWEQMFHENISKPFEAKNISKTEERLKKQVVKMKTVIADLTLELKKNDDEFM